MKRAATWLGTAAVACAAAAQGAGDLAELTLEELGSIEIVSASRRPERLSEASASVYVVSGELIRRSGVRTLPEALRLAPNLQVARVDGSQYAISARGFNNAIGNKLLVLIDGRTVYTPFFSGVFWDQQDVMLEDVERIEVISGPGAALWGANAVNGVINVITRRAADSQGVLAVADAGSRDQGLALRYGGRLGDNGFFRLYAKTDRVDHTASEAAAPVADGQRRRQIGWRMDWGSAADGFTLQGDAYSGKSDERAAFGTVQIGAVETEGANLLARWTRRLGDGSDFRLQSYYSHSEREDRLVYRPRERIFDIEFQHGFARGGHRLLWGGGWRHARDDIEPALFLGFDPQRKSSRWANLFVHDDIALGEKFSAVLGAKLEHNGYTGTELLPSARLEWKPVQGHFVWSALSRAVRAPARLDRDIRLPPQPPFLIAGGPDFVSEVAKVFELGYRAQPSPRWNYSATAFRHSWDRLRSGQVPPNALVQNMIEGSTWGVEAWGEWQPASWARIGGGLVLLRKDLRVKAGSTDPSGPANLGNDPQHQWSLRAAFNLPHRQELDIAVRRVGALPQPAVPAYTTADLRYGWRVSPALELSLIGQNLFDPRHPEFNAAPGRSEIPRSVWLRLRWTP